MKIKGATSRPAHVRNSAALSLRFKCIRHLEKIISVFALVLASVLKTRRYTTMYMRVFLSLFILVFTRETTISISPQDLNFGSPNRSKNRSYLLDWHAKNEHRKVVIQPVQLIESQVAQAPLGTVNMTLRDDVIVFVISIF